MKKLTFILAASLLLFSCSPARYTVYYQDKNGLVHCVNNTTVKEINTLRYGK